ncbi:MAG TPA: Hsp20/alpha crystallin family protein [Saprospiraceae bacterium]|nr:Hsp20/alpha crystallin family protein [Saprospiraceae bacterium]HMU03534.1 Hsp20/alpha crystallin family protein [Saprospiraceae bacterium]
MTNVMFRPVSQIQRPNHFKSFANPSVGQLPHQVKKSPAFANIKEFDGHFLISLAIPGFNKSNVEIKQEKNILIVQGKQEANNDVKFLKKEFAPTEFTRTFTLPEDVNADAISATFEQGILNITVPKGEKAQPKKIEIL